MKIFSSLDVLNEMKKSKIFILRYNIRDFYCDGFKNKILVLFFSCGKLELKLLSWRIICCLNFFYFVLV